MQYSFALITGFLRAFFLSGGWLWRAPLLVALVPPFKEEAQPMLDWLGIGDWPSWSFYLVAAAAAVIILASRITYLETLRLRFGSLSCITENNRISIRLPVKNISWKKAEVVASLVVLDNNGKPLAGCNDPFIILTSKRLERRDPETLKSQPGPFVLRSQPKLLVLAWIKPGNDHLTIPHENDDKDVELGDFRMVVTVDGAGIAKRDISISRHENILTLKNKKETLTVII